MEQDEILATAESILTRRCGGSQKFTEVARLSGSGVAELYRARVATNPFLQHRTVVVKHSPETGNELEDAAFLREVVAYQFTTSLPSEVRPGPVLLGYDLDARTIIISDCGDGETLATLLEQADEQQHVQILRHLGTALGRLHAGTAGKEEQYEVLFRRLTKARPGSEAVQHLRDRMLAHRIRLGLALIERSGIDAPREVASAAANIETRLLRGGARSFTPFDLSPDNVIYASDGTQFLDYEWAGFRDATFDVAFIVAGFPLYLSPRTYSYNSEAAHAFIDAWLREVSETWPLLKHTDTLRARITGALLGWALSSVSVLDPVALADVAADDAELVAEFAVAGLELASDADELDYGVLGDVMRPADRGPFTTAEVLVRADLRETFNALASYAGEGADPAYAKTADFARRVAARLGASGAT